MVAKNVNVLECRKRQPFEGKLETAGKAMEPRES